MPNALRVGLLGPLQVREGTGRLVHIGGRQLRVLLTLLALNAGRVVPAGSLAGQIWPGDPPGNPGNALQTLVSRLRAGLRQAGIDDVIESHPAGYRLAVPPDAIDVMAFEALAAQGRRALADGDAGQAARVLRDALLAWRGQPLADAAGCDFADAAAAKLTELRSSVLADRIEADLALGEGASLVGELRVLVSADPLAERPRALLMRALYAAGRQAEALAAYREGRELLADQLGVDPSAHLEQVYLGILRGGERLAAVARSPAGPHDLSPDAERAVLHAQAHVSAVRVHSPLTSFVGRDEDVSRVLRTLAPAQLAERLDDRFALLTGGSRTALPRHRTLRAVVNWSWDLLSASEQVLARRLAIFPGGATLAAAEHVCADELLPSAAVLPALSGLVDKSILTTVESPDGLGSRYRMLETVRAYGLERLADAGEEAVVRDGDSERSAGHSDAAAWRGLVRAELHFREGDTAATARVCAEQLAWFEGKQSAWWHGLRAVIQARLALAVLADGDKDRCRVLLADALRVASDWVELPPLADVIDAIAVFTRHDECGERDKLAATLLGAAHSIRGCFDEGSLDAPAARDSLRTRLGPDEFAAAYDHGRALVHDEALALAAGAVADPVEAG